ncbi:hypothetical protein GN956_G6852 [Arapaima gigas]
MSDPEAARAHPARHSYRCLDLFLVVSVLFLYVCVLGGAVYTALYLRLDRKVQVPPTADSPQNQQFFQPVTPQMNKMQKVAFFHLETATVKNGEMVSWKAVEFIDIHSVGTFYLYDQNNYTLKVQKQGIYLLFISLKFKSTDATSKNEKPSGKFTLDFNKFHCQVDLREGPVQHCVDILFLSSNTQLLARMHVTNNSTYWKVDPNASKFGIILQEELL